MTKREVRVFPTQSQFISYSIEQYILDLDLDLAEITQNDRFVIINLACPRFKRESEGGRSFRTVLKRA